MDSPVSRQPRQTAESLRQILTDVAFEDYRFHVGEYGHGFYLQIRYLEPDVETGDPADQHGRKWIVSAFATKSEVVQTAFKAVLTSMEHRAREHFTYRGERVFGPHFDVEALVELC